MPLSRRRAKPQACFDIDWHRASLAVSRVCGPVPPKGTIPPPFAPLKLALPKSAGSKNLGPTFCD